MSDTSATRPMALATGTRLGPYEIHSLLGRGGMGEVYRARDTRLDRTVAIKILTADVAENGERLARFEREAHAIAKLDHQHVCGIYDVGEAGGIHYLVMPYLEGETLASRLENGPLPLDLALRVAIETASALQAAHRVGIIHRDLKPANIFLARRGTAATPAQTKLLDFGLAKLRPSAAVLSVSTIEPKATTHDTAQGTILGTFHYMSPEQVEGRDADGRSDLWALGVVIYEMVTGTKPFSGGSAMSVIGSILKDTPPAISTRQPFAPAALDRIVTACLMKDPEERWQSAADVKRELEWTAAGDTTATPVRRADRRRAAAIVTALAAGVAIGAAGSWIALRSLSTAPGQQNSAAPVIFSIEPPPGTVLAGPAASISVPQLALSPDGRQLAFVASGANGRPALWLRPLDALQARRLPGTDDAADPFWAPDSEQLGFFSRGTLKATRVTGDSSPRTLSQTLMDSRGASWNEEGSIVFYAARAAAFSRVHEAGGTVTEMRLEGASGTPRWPRFLPGGNILFQLPSAAVDQRGIYVSSVSPPGTRRVIGTDWAAQFGSGHLLYLDGRTLMAQPFDPSTGSSRGSPVSVARDVGAASIGDASFSVSSNGVLAYTSGFATRSELRWFDRSGRAGTAVLPVDDYVDFSLSPDQSRLAYSRTDPDTQAPDIWILDFARGTSTRVTAERLVEASPTWSPDGARLAFRSNRASSIGGDLFETSASAGGTARRIVGFDQPLASGRPSNVVPAAWSQNGRVMFYLATAQTGYGIWSTSTDRPDPRIEIDTEDNEFQPSISPDGRWLAYVSDQSGRNEVYVQEFGGGAQRTLVSNAGGLQPRWRSDSQELYYLQNDGALMQVTLRPGPKLDPRAPSLLFRTHLSTTFNPYRMDYVPAAAGQRFLMKVPSGASSPTITIVSNWPSLLSKD